MTPRVRILGHLEVLADDGTPAALTAVQRTVLAVLAVDLGRVIPAPVLLARAWPGREASTGTMQSTVSRLRTRIGADGPAMIVTGDGGYRLAVRPEQVDSHLFVTGLAAARRAFVEGRPEQARVAIDDALALWRGRPYGGVDAEIDAVLADAVRLEDLRVTAHELAAEIDLELGRDAEVVAALTPLVAELPLRERLRVCLMTALYRSGRQAEALRVFDDARRVLAEELGIDPGADLRRVHELVLRQDPALDAPRRRTSDAVEGSGTAARPAERMTERGRGADALVGRDDVWRKATELARPTADPGPLAVVAVQGEAGIGKTSLVEAVAAEIGAEGPTVAWGRCLDHDGSPSFWPWTQLLTGVAERLGTDATAAALAGRAADAAVLLPAALHPATMPDAASTTPAPEQARRHLFEAVVGFLRAAAVSAPLVLVLEDLQWADDDTVRLTEYVTATLVDAPVSLVVTVRDPDAATAAADVLAGLRHVHVVELTGLDVADVQELARRRSGRELPEEAARRLHRRTNGNPFYVEELVRLVAAERDAGAAGDASVPPTVRAAIERRLRHLEPGTRDLLAAAAVIGPRLDLGVLGAVAERSVRAMVLPLDAAVQAGVLLVDDVSTGSYRFAHALVQEALVAATGPMRRAALHAQIAEALAASPAETLPDLAGTIARHLGAAGVMGDREEHVRFTLMAADVAARRLAFVDAERASRDAVDLAGAVPGATGAALELQARLQLGSLLSQLRGYSDPEVAVQRERTVELALATGAADALLPGLWGSWGVALVSADYVAADDRAADLFAAADRTGDPLLELAYHHAAGQNRYSQGRFVEAIPHLRRAVELTDRHHNAIDLAVWLQHPAVAARGWLATVLTITGQEAEGDAVAAAAGEHAERLGHPFTQAYHHILEGWRARFRRQPDVALARGAAAGAITTEHGYDQLTGFALGSFGWAVAESGDPATGLAQIDTVLELFGAVVPDHMYRHMILLAKAEVLRDLGDRDGAESAARAALAHSDRTGERIQRATLHAVLAGLLTDPAEAAEHSALAVAVAAEQQAALYATQWDEGAPGILGRDPRGSAR